MTEPPGNSLDGVQGERVADPGEDLAAGLRALLARIGEELDFNDAKGTAPTGSACTTGCASPRTRSPTCSAGTATRPRRRSGRSTPSASG